MTRSAGGAGGHHPRAGGGPPRSEVVVNGETLSLTPGTTVAQLVARTCPSERGVAVAVDREVVPRSEWEVTVVDPGSLVEVVEAAAGG
jgi:sulfur carrier protein